MSAKPGRRKTIDRAHVLQVATAIYWENGPTDVPIAEICDLAGTSKPALYREFGNDDGLRVAVLQQYRETTLRMLFETIRQSKPFLQIVEDVLDLVLPKDPISEAPGGCLVIAMRGRKARLGEMTLAKLEGLQAEQIEVYRQWIIAGQADGSVRPELAPEFAAQFINMQFTGAMQMQREGVSNQQLADGLRLAFATLAVAQ